MITRGFLAFASIFIDSSTAIPSITGMFRSSTTKSGSRSAMASDSDSGLAMQLVMASDSDSRLAMQLVMALDSDSRLAMELACESATVTRVELCARRVVGVFVLSHGDNPCLIFEKPDGELPALFLREFEHLPFDFSETYCRTFTSASDVNQ